MNSPLVRSTRGDAIDAEQFEKMIASAPFARLWRRVAAERDRAEAACLREDGLVELRRAQGAAAFGRTMAKLPEQILAELRPK